MDEDHPTTGNEHSPEGAWVHEAVVELLENADPRAVGAAVTVALCGHWEHEGPCRWPHNNELVEGGLFRTLFVCEADEEPEVRTLIQGALGGASEWRVVTERARPVAAGERALAERLVRLPRRS
jgi:hypothetical protein